MTYVFLLLWTATAQAPPTAQQQEQQPVKALVNANERMRRELEVARGQLAKVEEQAAMPDHAVAALLVSDRPDLTSLVRVASRGADRGIRRAQIDVYLSPHQGETMIAVIVNLKNLRNEETWEPREAQVKTAPAGTAQRRGQAVRWLPTIPAAVRSIPQRILPGQPARIAVVFDKADVGLDGGPVVVELLREGKWEFEFELHPSDVHPSSKAGGSRWPQ